MEERGFGSLFWTEHTHIPVRSRRTSGGPTRGAMREIWTAEEAEYHGEFVDFGEPPRFAPAPPMLGGDRCRSRCFGAIPEGGPMPDPGLLDAYADAGADRSLFTPQYRSADEALSLLDKWATLIR